MDKLSPNINLVSDNLSLSIKRAIPCCQVYMIVYTTKDVEWEEQQWRIVSKMP